MLLRWNMDHLDLPGASEALRARTLFATGVGTLRCVGAAAVARSRTLSSSLLLSRDSFVAELSVHMLENCIDGVFGRCLRVEAAEVLELLENSSSGSVHWVSCGTTMLADFDVPSSTDIDSGLFFFANDDLLLLVCVGRGR